MDNKPGGPLENKTALITGAGRGIGQGIAKTFAEAGCDVALMARTAQELAIAAKDVARAGRRSIELVCDVTDRPAVEGSVARVLETFGRIDILVNNAGYACFKPFEQLTAAEWARTLDVNLSGPFNLIQAVLPSMKQRRSGKIINVSSVAG